jgi:chitin disaccharide deacetylase
VQATVPCAKRKHADDGHDDNLSPMRRTQPQRRSQLSIRVHADDIGVSRGVTDEILKCIDEGPVRSVSVLPNGAAFEYAVEALAARPSIAVSAHLNLVEGRPVSPERLDLLVDRDGFLNNGFLSLWRAHAVSSAARRARLAAQVRTELQAQACKLRAALGPGRPMRLDSHMHLHHIPFVFRIVADLSAELSAAGVRLVHEPFSFGKASLRHHTAAGHCKRVLLNALSARHRRELIARGIASDDWFVGALLMGRLSADAVDASLRRISAAARPSAEDVSIEIAFHPALAARGEESIWERYPAIRDYYFSDWRGFESAALRSGEMAACLARWGNSSPAPEARNESTRGS